MRRNKKKSLKKPLLVIILLIFLLGIVVGFIIDMRMIQQKRATRSKTPQAEELNDILLGTSGRLYKDPAGLFQITIPSAWKVQRPSPKESPYNVVLSSPNGYDVSIIATRVSPGASHALERDLEKIQRRYGINMNVEPIVFNGLDAFKRMVVLHYDKLTVIDFIHENISHEIQLRIPHRYNEQVEDIIMEVVKTYQPATQGNGHGEE